MFTYKMSKKQLTLVAASAALGVGLIGGIGQTLRTLAVEKSVRQDNGVVATESAIKLKNGLNHDFNPNYKNHDVFCAEGNIVYISFSGDRYNVEINKDLSISLIPQNPELRRMNPRVTYPFPHKELRQRMIHSSPSPCPTAPAPAIAR